MLNRMILLFSGANVPWTVGGGQPRMLTKILMIAAVRHAAAPAQKQKIAMARASSMDLGPCSKSNPPGCAGAWQVLLMVLVPRKF